MNILHRIYFDGLFLTNPRLVYVPPSVWQNKYFWLLLFLVVTASLLFRNRLTTLANSSINGLSKPRPGRDPEAPKIQYSSDGRSGHVHYQSKGAGFALYYEFGGGDCIASIDIPSPADWVARTGIPLQKREETLHHIGQQVVKDQTVGGSGHYEIKDNWIYIKK